MLNPNPLVSCVMPTKNRRQFIGAAIACWQQQDYENTELIIVDDGEDKTGDLVPDDKRIRYIEQEAPSRMSLGRKRNYCNSLANGEIICHFDTDDWSDPGRIRYQLFLLQKSGKPVTGFSNLYFWDTVKLHARRYRAYRKGYVCGTSLMYRKDFWQKHQFPDKQVASDNDFVRSIIDQIEASTDWPFMVARIHKDKINSNNNIREIVDTGLIPRAFWDNERLRLSGDHNG